MQLILFYIIIPVFSVHTANLFAYERTRLGVPMLIALLGVIMNAMAVGANNGKMPVLPRNASHARSLDKEKSWRHRRLTKHAKLKCLSDIHHAGRLLSFSIGDVLIVGGYILLCMLA